MNMATRKLLDKASLALCAVALVALALAGCQQGSGLPETGVVTKVFDGDTVEVTASGTDYKVRLIGVDTPEAWPSNKLTRDARRTRRDEETIMALGRKATAFTRELCEGKPCRLEYDPANVLDDHRDTFGRLLAFLYVTGRGGEEVLVNAAIIREGYGHAMTRYAFDEEKKERFRQLQREAREAGAGLWADEAFRR
jgi:micrococcal nuclease